MPANDRCFPFLNKMYVTSLFGPRTPVATTFGTSSTDHMGIDLVGKGSIIVVASAPGTVKRVQYMAIMFGLQMMMVLVLFMHI